VTEWYEILIYLGTEKMNMNSWKNLPVLVLFALFVNSALAKNIADSVSQTEKVVAFNSLKINGNFNVVLTEGKTSSLKIVAPDKDAMSSVVIKSAVILNVSMKDGAKEAVTLYITVKDIQQISVNIDGTLSCTNTIDEDNLTLNVDGNATVNLALDLKMLTCNLNSGKSIVLKGKAKSCIFKDSGEGNVDASELKTDNMTLEDHSDGDLKVYAHPELHAKVSGSGKLTYYGNPRTKTFRIEGAASEQQVIENK
jgi:hypothetical protein